MKLTSNHAPVWDNTEVENFVTTFPKSTYGN